MPGSAECIPRMTREIVAKTALGIGLDESPWWG
jgi:hypothetical protein